jgi:predicted DCC family thiol-disulfide oxidoreductase YuxK
MAEAQPQPVDSVDSRVVLYDGVCGFCDGLVRWLLARDRAGALRYAPLQGRTAARLRERHPEIPGDLETVVYVESSGGRERVFLRSEAMFRVFQQLGAPWGWLAWLRWLPRAFTDAAYGLFVRVRYRLFGRLDACRVPDPARRERFLD